MGVGDLLLAGGRGIAAFLAVRSVSTVAGRAGGVCGFCVGEEGSGVGVSKKCRIFAAIKCRIFVGKFN